MIGQTRRTMLKMGAAAATIAAAPQLFVTGQAAATTFSLNIKDFGAVGDGTHDDSASIQAAIDAAYASGFGGARVQAPPGIYYIPSGIVMKGGVCFEGTSRTTVLLRVNSVNVDAVTFDPTCNYAELRDLSVYGTDPGPNTGLNAVRVSPAVAVNLTNLNIFGGYDALTDAGVDGFRSNCFISTTMNANVNSSGANWWERVKFDAGGATAPNFAWYQGKATFGTATESHFTDCDFSGNFKQMAMMVNDLGQHGAYLAIKGGAIGAPIVLTSARALCLEAGLELGADVYNNDTLAMVDVTGCFGTNGPGNPTRIHGPANITGGFNIVHA
jgi:hypothetical protein